MKKTLPLFFMGVLSSALLFSQSQLQVFRDWTTTAGTQNFFYKNVTKTDASGNVYVAGATMNGAGNYDILIAKYNFAGTQQWIRQIDGAAHYQDFATALLVDGSSNVYVTGAISDDTTSATTDLFITKYNSSGTQQWIETYNGSGNNNDCGTDILVNSAGNVCVCGSTMNSSMNYDFVTRVYNSSGTLGWSQVYNYSSGLNDVPVQIQKSGNSLVISGGVQTGTTTYDWAVVKYSNTGVFQSATISSGGTSGIEEVHAMVTDASGNIYMAGETPTMSNGDDYDVIKLDSNLVIQWEHTYDGADHLDDVANGIQVNASGDVYVTGFSKTSAAGKDYLTLKYNSSGSLTWTKTFNDSLNGDDAANALVLATDGKIYITGSAYKSATQKLNYHTMKYDTAGTVLWSVDFDGSHHLNDQATNLALNDAGDVIVTGESETATNVYEYSTVKYLENITMPTPATMGTTYNADGVAMNERSTVIVRFNPDYLIMNNIDNRDMHASHASTFIADTVLYMMGQKLFTGTPTERLMKMRNVDTRKIFTYMASADSISTTRSGEKMHVPPFWATLELFLPGTDERNICDSLQHIFPQIYYAHPNYAFAPQSVPNDSLYADQGSLAPTVTYPYSNINVEPAWDIETGKKFVKVGVYDVGIDPLHPDIDVAERVDIEAEVYSGVPQPTGGHGTSTSGIIGAKRNNSIGIAGIAGGVGPDSTGCSIYDIDIGGEEIFADEASQGIIVGAANYYYNTPAPYLVPEVRGLSLQVMNHSWGGVLNNFAREVPPDTTKIPGGSFACDLCLEAMEFSFRNGCISAAARGNFYQTVLNTLAQPTDRWFPSCIKDEFVLNVGAVGTDGKHKVAFNGGDNTDTYESMYHWNVDVVAPGNNGTVYTAYSETIAPYTQLYSSFSGTSAAAPHVAGVVALMLSHVNTPCPSEKNLSPEDVEYILQKTASPRITGVTYDDTTGFGLLDAGAALQAIQEPQYQIIHVNNTPVSVSTTFFDTACLYLYSPYTAVNGPYLNRLPNIHDGYYYVDVYKTTVTVNHTSNLSHLTSSATILDKWVRNSSSVGWGRYKSVDHLGFWARDTVDVTSNVAFDSAGFDANTATLTAYTYYVKNSVDSTVTVNQWYPSDTSQFKFSYSIYVYDPDATSVPAYPCDSTVFVQEHKPIPQALSINSIYPNPATDEITIEYSIPYNEQASVNMFDLLGRNVKTMGITSRVNGTYKVFINISNLAKGTYLLQVKTNKETAQKKILIIR